MLSPLGEKGVIQGASQVGLAGSIGARFTAGASISAGQPPATRIATTIGLGIAGGAIHVGASAVNRSLTLMDSDNNINNNNNDNPPSPKNDFLNSPLEEIFNNPVELLLYSIWVLEFVILFFLIFLFFTFISKLLVSLDYLLNWLDKIFSKDNSIKIRYVVLKI